MRSQQSQREQVLAPAELRAETSAQPVLQVGAHSWEQQLTPSQLLLQLQPTEAFFFPENKPFLSVTARVD